MIFKLITFLIGKLSDKQKEELRDLLVKMVGAAAEGAVKGSMKSNAPFPG